MTAQVLFFDVFPKKDPHLNAVEQPIKLKGFFIPASPSIFAEKRFSHLPHLTY